MLVLLAFLSIFRRFGRGRVAHMRHLLAFLFGALLFVYTLVKENVRRLQVATARARFCQAEERL